MEFSDGAGNSTFMGMDLVKLLKAATPGFRKTINENTTQESTEASTQYWIDPGILTEASWLLLKISHLERIQMFKKLSLVSHLKKDNNIKKNLFSDADPFLYIVFNGHWKKQIHISHRYTFNNHYNLICRKYILNTACKHITNAQLCRMASDKRVVCNVSVQLRGWPNNPKQHEVLP